MLARYGIRAQQHYGMWIPFRAHRLHGGEHQARIYRWKDMPCKEVHCCGYEVVDLKCVGAHG